MRSRITHVPADPFGVTRTSPGPIVRVRPVVGDDVGVALEDQRDLVVGALERPRVGIAFPEPGRDRAAGGREDVRLETPRRDLAGSVDQLTPSVTIVRPFDLIVAPCVALIRRSASRRRPSAHVARLRGLDFRPVHRDVDRG